MADIERFLEFLNFVIRIQSVRQCTISLFAQAMRIGIIRLLRDVQAVKTFACFSTTGVAKVIEAQICIFKLQMIGEVELFKMHVFCTAKYAREKEIYKKIVNTHICEQN